MRKFQLVLAYYTLFASGGLFFWSIFLAPKPLGFFIALIVIPVGIYFWIIILGKSKIKAVEYPKEAKSEEALAKLSLVILTTLLISTASMFAFSFINTKLLEPANDIPSSVSSRLSLIEQEVEKQNQDRVESTDKILEEIGNLKKETLGVKDENLVTDSINKKAGVDSSGLSGVTIKSKDYEKVNVYKEDSSSSEVLGQAEFGKTYSFLEKKGDWYLILFTNGSSTTAGYINALFVKEVEY